MRSASVRQSDMKRTTLLAAACALLVSLSACGQAATDAGGSGSSPDDPVTGKPSGDQAPGGAKLVTPQRNAASVIPGHWHKAKLVDQDTVRVFFWGGVEACSVLDSVDVRYGPDQVALTLFQGTPASAAAKICPELAVLKVVEVDLTEPLGGRKLVDGADKRER
jgi:hypothetical protein